MRHEAPLTPAIVLRGLGIIGEKPPVDDGAALLATQSLPIHHGKPAQTHLLGTGDMDRLRSSGGSVCVRDGDIVAKFPLGEPTDDSQTPFERVRHLADLAAAYEEISPPTMVILAKINNSGPPVPVIIQAYREGKSVADVPFIDILQGPVVGSLRVIQGKIDTVFRNTGVLDLSGLPFTHTLWWIIFGGTLPFSDNVIVTPANKALLVDNTPDPKVHHVDWLGVKWLRPYFSLRGRVSEAILSVMETILSIGHRNQTTVLRELEPEA